MDDAQLATECVAAADELIERRLWEDLGNEDLLVFDIPGRQLVLGSVMGAGGDEFGLILMVGPAALDDFRAMLGGAHPRLASWSSTMLSMSLARTADLDRPFARLLEQAGRRGRTAPVFLAKEPEQLARAARRPELETLLYAMRGLLAASASGELHADGSAAAGILPALRITGSPRAPAVTVDLASVAESGARELPEIEVPSDLGELPRVDGTWLVGLPVMPMAVDGVPGEARALAVLDATTGKAVALEVVAGPDLDAAAQKLFATMRGEGESAPPGLPQRLVFASEPLFSALRGGFDALGVTCDHDTHVPELDAMLDELEKWLRGQDVFDPDGVPAPDDLEGWKDVDGRVTVRLVQAAGDRPFEPGNKAWKRYTGGVSDAPPSDPDDREEMMLMAYLDWFVLDYRATKRSKPVAQRLLAGDLPPAERSVLQARAAARPSFYRVTGIDRGDSVELLDVLSGSTCRLNDKSLSLTAVRDMVIIARVYRVGAFCFATLCGPPLRSNDSTRALGYLESEHGLRPGDYIDAPVAHLLGRLWRWADEHTGLDRIVLQNQDGEALRWHAARFDVGDTAALCAALDQRNDVEVQEPAAEWSWRRGDLHLGTLTLYDRELLLDVNSAERFAAARAWLEDIPGVTFATVEEKNVDPRLPDDRPLDDRLPAPEPQPLAPEDLAGIQSFMNEKYFAWLDEPIPALGGRTPRQACATEPGRRKVAQMIRTYPDPGGIPGVTVPRREMLAELGLDDGEAAEE